MTAFLGSLCIFLFAIAIMSLGVIFGNKRIRGSCGGVALIDSNGESLTCDTCPNRSKNQCEREESAGSPRPGS